MKAKQKKIRVFDIIIKEEKSFFDFMEKNFILIKDYLLLISGEVTPKIEDYLKNNSLCYVLADGCSLKKIDSKNEPEKILPKEEDTPKTQVIYQEKVIYQNESKSIKTKVITKPVRSGEVIEHDGDIVIFSRVNSGAKVISEGNISIFEVVDGVIEANGDFVLLKSIGKGYVLFNGDILNRDDFDGTLKKVLVCEDGYKIEDI